MHIRSLPFALGTTTGFASHFGWIGQAGPPAEVEGRRVPGEPDGRDLLVEVEIERGDRHRLGVLGGEGQAVARRIPDGQPIAGSPAASHVPSGLKARQRTASCSPASGSPSSFPVAVSQRCTSLSLPPEASTMPSALNARTATPWPEATSGSPTGFQVVMSHSRMVSSELAAASTLPVGLIATSTTADEAPVEAPFRVRVRGRFWRSHITTSPPEPPDTMV